MSMDLEMRGGALWELAMAAKQHGRDADASRFHTEALVGFLGRPASPVAAVALHLRVDDRGRAVADFVHDLEGADVLLARTGPAELTTVALSPAEHTVEPQPTIDDERCVRVSFGLSGARTEADIELAVAQAAIVRCADAVGAAEAALEAAVDRVKARQLFGGALGAMQAVQHRCADMLMDLTMARDAVFDAVAIVDRGASRDDVRLAAAYAKASAVERCRRVTASAHQLAGGQGVDQAAPFHRWYRRVKGVEPALGDARSHRERIASALLD